MHSRQRGAMRSVFWLLGTTLPRLPCSGHLTGSTFRSILWCSR